MQKNQFIKILVKDKYHELDGCRFDTVFIFNIRS